MMRKISAIFAMLMALSLMAAPAFAQRGLTAAPATIQEEDVASWYARIYLPDPAAGDAVGDVQMIMVAGLEEVEGLEVTSEMLEQSSCEFASGYFSNVPQDPENCDELAAAGVEITSDIAINNANAIELIGTADIGIETPAVMLVVQADPYIFFAIYMGTNEVGVADDLAAYLVDAETSLAPVELDENGFSTGGMFDMLPADDGELLANYLPVTDLDLFAAAQEEQ